MKRVATGRNAASSHGDPANRRFQASFYTMSSVAEMLQVSPRTVRRWIDNDDLIAHRIGGIVRISHADLHAFLSRYRE